MTYFFEGKILAGYILIYACFLILYGIRRKKTELLLFFLPGLLIELLQLAQLLVIGYTLRVVDVNDLICNAAGTAAGYLVFRAVRKGIAALNRKPEREKERLAEYFMNR